MCTYKWILFFMSIFLLTCSNSTDSNNIRLSDWRYPIINILYFTDSEGNIIGEWRNPYINSPDYGNSLHEPSIKNTMSKVSTIDSFYFDPPFPSPKYNPTHTLRFGIPARTHVLIYLVPAVLHPEDAEVSLNTSDSFVYIPGGLAIRVLMNDVLEPGYYRVTWDGRDEWGNLVRPGFYRWVLEAGQFVAARDILFVRDVCDVPMEIRSFLPENLQCN